MKDKMYVLKQYMLVEPQELKDTLNSLKIPATKITLLKRDQYDPLYLVHFEKGAITPAILNSQHRSIGNLMVKWEKFQKSAKKVTQCHNCQRFGHSASNCGHSYRCVKCINNHLPGQCSRKTREGSAKCVNCDGDHPANSHTCPSYIEYIDRIEKLRKPKTIKPRYFTSTQAPWSNYNSNFPPLTPTEILSQPNPILSSLNNSQTIVPPTNPSERLKFFRNSNISSQNVNQSPVDNSSSDNSFNELSKLRNDFCSIPNINETLKLYRELIGKLQNEPDHKNRIAILIEYTAP
jgi:hypothetical protein